MCAAVSLGKTVLESILGAVLCAGTVEGVEMGDMIPPGFINPGLNINSVAAFLNCFMLQTTQLYPSGILILSTNTNKQTN